MLSGWLGDEQPPADWENWINQTTIDKINEMIPAVNNGIDMVNGGWYHPENVISWDFRGFTIANPCFWLRGADSSPYAFVCETDADNLAATIGNLTGKALRITGKSVSPTRSPFEIVPVDTLPTLFGANNRGDLCLVNGSLVYYDKTGGQARMVRSVGLTSENLFLSLGDMSTNETAGVRDWNFNAAGLPTNIVSRNARPCYAACFPLIGRVPYYNVYLSSIQVRLTPGVIRANVATRMSVLLIDAISGVALSGVVRDNGTAAIQVITVPCNLNLDFSTQSPTIIVTPGTTNGIDTVHEVQITFNGVAL